MTLQNVVLSGGSTMFRDFGRRLKRDLQRVVDARLRVSEELSGGRIKVSGNSSYSATDDAMFSILYFILCAFC